jgi:hypothetical protein
MIAILEYMSKPSINALQNQNFQCSKLSWHPCCCCVSYSPSELHDELLTVGSLIHASNNFRPDGSYIGSFSAAESKYHAEYNRAGTYR